MWITFLLWVHALFSVPHIYAGSYKYCTKTISQVNVFPNAKAVRRIDKTYLHGSMSIASDMFFETVTRAVPDPTCAILVLLRHSTGSRLYNSLAYIANNIWNSTPVNSRLWIILLSLYEHTILYESYFEKTPNKYLPLLSGNCQSQRNIRLYLIHCTIHNTSSQWKVHL